MPTCFFLSRMLASAAVFVLVGLAAAPPAHAQFGAASEQEMESMSIEDLLKDFAHFVTIRQDELAAAYANAILDRDVSPREFVGIVEDSPRVSRNFDSMIRRALFVPTIEDEAAGLLTLYEEGRRQRARDPEEIARNIRLLTGSPRARDLAKQRLSAAGEYAVPQLLEVLLARTNPSLESQARQLLSDMGGDAVMPLSVALPAVDDTTKAKVALVLGRIQYGAALPYLYDTLRSTSVDSVRDACRRAIELIQGSVNEDQSVAALYADLAEAYFNESQSLTRFPGEEFQLVWRFEPQTGLYPTPIRTPVFHEARAMELCERAMTLDADNRRAAALWLASNFSREIDSPEGYDNPAYTRDRGALYYAVAAGSEPTQRVLDRALDRRDTPLARRVIEALSQGAGGARLWEGLGDERPLLDALSYPDRRVQYEAALAIGRAKPRRTFPGAQRVAPILAGAVRDASARFAIVVGADEERRQEIFSSLEGLGYTVLQAGRSLGDVASAVANAPGVDMIVADLGRDSTLALLDEVRSSPKLGVAPVLALLPQAAWNELWPRYETDPLTEVRREGIDSQQLSNSIETLAMVATGPAIDAEAARGYAMESLAVLRDLAISRNPVFNVGDAAVSLIAALDETEGEVRLRVADVLARIDQSRAQVALMDAALSAGGAEQVALLETVAESAKSYGNMLERRQVRDLLALAGESESTQIATAAAALVGVLNLPQNNLTTLIVESA